MSKFLGQDSRFPDRGLNPRSPEQESGVLPPLLRHSVLEQQNIHNEQYSYKYEQYQTFIRGTKATVVVLRDA
jgi:hypothetical protein